MTGELTSRERLLRALDCQEVDHIPCCLMSFAVMRQRKDEDWYAVANAEKAMGLDPMLFIPLAPRRERREHPDLRGLPVRFSPKVRIHTWIEETGEEFPLLHKEYDTPAGKLTTTVRLSEDWPHGNHIPFIDDYQVPRALKPLVTGPQDLEALRYLLLPPAEVDILAFQKEAQEARLFTQELGFLLSCGWGVGMDMANWLCGMQNLILLAVDQPDFVEQLLEMIHQWNVQRMKVILASGVDLYIRRAWYEGCDFITPRFYRTYVLPNLKKEADLAHEYGARFGYICSSGTKPMLDYYTQAGIDALIGVDPIQGTHTDMPLIKEKLGDRTCLWGGVSAAVTVERGSEEEVRAAVRGAIQILGPRGFILSPVDNLTVDEPRTWENLAVLIDEWNKFK